MDAPQTLQLRDFVTGRDEFSLLRPRLRRDVADAEHTHDFAELFWVESGAGLHRVNGVLQRLGPGTVVFIRPEDRHTFNSYHSTELQLVNVAFPAADLRWMQKRWGPQALPWKSGRLPQAQALPGSAVRRLSRIVADVMNGPLTTLELDYLLLSVIRESKTRALPASDGSLPMWLTRAIHAVRSDPALLNRGCEQFAELCHKSREHVNRTVRACLGLSTSQLLNRCKLDHAAFLLLDSDRTIMDVAFASGFENVSYFYRQFRACFGKSPRDYRSAIHS